MTEQLGHFDHGDPQYDEDADIATDPCVVCGKQVDTAKGGRRQVGRFGFVYFCQGQHTTAEINLAISRR